MKLKIKRFSFKDASYDKNRFIAKAEELILQNPEVLELDKEQSRDIEGWGFNSLDIWVDLYCKIKPKDVTETGEPRTVITDNIPPDELKRIAKVHKEIEEKIEEEKD